MLGIANHDYQNVAKVQEKFDRLDAGTNGAAPQTNGVSASSGPSASAAEDSIARTDPDRTDAVASATKAFEETGISEAAVGSV